MDLESLLEKWKDARLKYPQHRRAAEDEFFGGLVKSIRDLEAELERRKGGRPAKVEAA